MADIEVFPRPVDGAPEGYQTYVHTQVLPPGTNTINTYSTVCEECGVAVFSVHKHNLWHARLGRVTR